MERLQKILARAGFSSRRGAEQLIREGRVSLNGSVVQELGVKADPAHDELRVDGRRVRPPVGPPVYLLLNKPRGVVTTRSDPGGRQTVMELVPPTPGLFPVGRLDITTEGLLLLTNDGDFAEKMMHPRYEVPRVYRAKVRGTPDEATLRRLEQGVVVDGERMKVDAARVVGAGANAWLEVRLHEGRNREVRRLLGAVGHPVSKLRRISIGGLDDRGLPVGGYRALRPAEVAGLLRRSRSPRRTSGAGTRPRSRASARPRR